MGCDVRVFLDYGSKCKDGNSGKIEMVVAGGQTSEPYDAYKKDQFSDVQTRSGTAIDVDGKSFELAGSIDYSSQNNTAGVNNTAINLDK